jgi:GntR family transcriptional repressor for pyruvate dehydrogenase complex
MALLAGKKRKLGEIVIDEIRRMVHDGELKEGDKLPNQYEFAAELGVSRPSLREALHTLELMGVIEQKPGVGTVLKSDNVELWNEQPAPPMLSDREATRELLEARQELEALMMQFAIERITDAEIAELEEAVEGMRRAIDNRDAEAFFKDDVKFHYRLASSSHNRFFFHMFVTIRGMMEKLLHETFTVLPGISTVAQNTHVAILEAVKSRNKSEAVKLIRKHITNIEKGLQAYYEAKNKQ